MPSAVEHDSLSKAEVRRLADKRTVSLASVAIVLSAVIGTFSCRTTAPRGEERVDYTPAIPGIWSEEGLTARRLTMPHFDIISTIQDEAFETALPGFLESMYRRYTATMAPAVADAGRMTTYIFGSRAEWRRFTQARFPRRHELYGRILAGGFTEGDISVSFYSTRAASLATLAHEGWHQYLGSRFTTSIPAWLNEGFACYFEAVQFDGREARVSPDRNTFRINSLRTAIHEDRLLTLREIVDTDAGQVIAHTPGSVAQIYYAQAWALVTMLRNAAGGRYAASLQGMLDDITTGAFQVHVSAARVIGRSTADETYATSAFRAYFGRNPDQFESEYRNHLLQLAGYAQSDSTASE